jgi:kynurenine formamidase
MVSRPTLGRTMLRGLAGRQRRRCSRPIVSSSWLVEHRAGLVGIDSINIDDTSGPARPVHTALLAAGIPIVEHQSRLDQLPSTGFRFHAVPPPIVGVGSFPARVYAVLTSGEAVRNSG